MRYLYSLVAIVFLFCFVCCNTKQEDNNLKFKFPVIIENYEYGSDLKLTSIKGIYHGNHIVNYFGEMTDTLIIERVIRPKFNIPLPPSLDSSESKSISVKGKYDDYFINYGNGSYYKRDSFDLTIILDTSQIISNYGLKAYPVLIQNNSIDTVMIGNGKYIPIITEAKNRNGDWKSIEKIYRYVCGVGVHTLILPPNEIVVTSQLIYSGDFKTSLRIRFDDNYSEEFYGSINYSQFKD